MRNASGTQKFFAKYILHGMLRFAKITRTVAQGANAICSLATDEKFKGILTTALMFRPVTNDCIYYPLQFHGENLLCTGVPRNTGFLLKICQLCFYIFIVSRWP